MGIAGSYYGKKLKPGTPVLVERDAGEDGLPRLAATVVRYGRSSDGVYVRVRFADGETKDYHPSWVKKDAAAVVGVDGDPQFRAIWSAILKTFPGYLSAVDGLALARVIEGELMAARQQAASIARAEGK